MDYDKAAAYWTSKDSAAKKLDDKALLEHIEEFIRKENTCALATSSEGSTRCTPIEYMYSDGIFYMFSEGGLKFKNLKDNKRVGIAIFETYSGFGALKGLQAEGIAEIVEPFSEEYLRAMELRHIPETAMRKLPEPMNPIKIKPLFYDYLDSDLKNENVSVRQHFDC